MSTNRGAWFVDATFSGAAVFLGAKFGNDALFSEATFSRDAYVPNATFTGGAWFSRATFNSRAEFDGDIFGSKARFDETTFSGAEGSLSFARSNVLSPDAEHVWPTGWCLKPDGSGGYTVVRANDNGHSGSSPEDRASSAGSG